MTDAELNEIEARANAATKGPWFVGQAVPGLESVSRPDRRNIYCGDCSDVTSAAANIRIEDAEFIAHARSDIPLLLAEIKLLRKVVQAAEPAKDFGLEWAIAHQEDDHMVTMDHKDETALADLVADLCKALAAYQER